MPWICYSHSAALLFKLRWSSGKSTSLRSCWLGISVRSKKERDSWTSPHLICLERETKTSVPPSYLTPGKDQSWLWTFSSTQSHWPLPGYGAEQLNLSFFLSPQHSGNSLPHPSLYLPKKEKVKLYVTPHTSWNSSAERILYCPRPCTCHLIPKSLGKEYLKVVYCHPAYLTYIQTASCEMLDWMKGGIKIARRNTNNFKYADDTTLMAEVKRN